MATTVWELRPISSNDKITKSFILELTEDLDAWWDGKKVISKFSWAWIDIPKIISIMSDAANGSWLDEINKHDWYSAIPKGIKEDIFNLNTPDQELETDTEEQEETPNWLLQAWKNIWWLWLWMYLWGKAVWAIRRQIPNATKAGDIYNQIYNMLKSNNKEKPEVIRKRVDNFIKIVQNMSSKDIDNIGKKWYWELYNYIKGWIWQIIDVKKQALETIKWKTIDWNKILVELEKAIDKAKAARDDDLARDIEKVYNKTKEELEKTWWKIEAIAAEKIKEKSYDKSSAYENAEKMWMSPWDLNSWEWYKIRGRVIKEELEKLYDKTNKETKWVLKQINAQYWPAKDIEYSVWVELNKVQSDPVSSTMRKVWGKFKPVVAKTPLVPSQALPSLSPWAKKSEKLWDTLRYIKKRLAASAPELEKASEATSKVPRIWKYLWIWLGALWVWAAALWWETEAWYEWWNMPTNANNKINVWQPKYANTTMSAPDADTEIAMKQYAKQEAKKPKVTYVEKWPMSKKWEDIVKAASYLLPWVWEASIALDVKKWIQEGKTLEQMVNIQRQKTQQKKKDIKFANIKTWAWSIASMPKFSLPPKKK